MLSLLLRAVITVATLYIEHCRKYHVTSVIINNQHYFKFMSETIVDFICYVNKVLGNATVYSTGVP